MFCIFHATGKAKMHRKREKHFINILFVFNIASKNCLKNNKMAKLRGIAPTSIYAAAVPPKISLVKK